jgi:hypothetical protein
MNNIRTIYIPTFNHIGDFDSRLRLIGDFDSRL